MPWKECHVMDERLRFVARLLEGEKMAPLCAEFGISRKTGYKIFDRYKDCGVQAFLRHWRQVVRVAYRGGASVPFGTITARATPSHAAFPGLPSESALRGMAPVAWGSRWNLAMR